VANKNNIYRKDFDHRDTNKYNDYDCDDGGIRKTDTQTWRLSKAEEFSGFAVGL